LKTIKKRQKLLKYKQCIANGAMQFLDEINRRMKNATSDFKCIFEMDIILQKESVQDALKVQ
jgi:hypothetical protein